MDSILPIEQTGGLVFFNLCLILLMYILMKKSLYAPYVVTSSNKMTTTLIMYLFVLFSFWGSDWFHYVEAYISLKAGFRGSLEEIYVWIAQNLSPNYIVFRFVIWGGSLCLLLHIFKRLSIPTNLAIFFFSTIYIIWFSYARVTAAMVLVYYGLIVLYKPYKNRFLSILLGILVIWGAFFFHKSALFGIVAVLLTLLVNSFQKKALIIMLLCYPILIYLAQAVLSDILIADVSAEDGALGQSLVTGQAYLERDSFESGWGGLFQRFLERFPHFLLAYISILFTRSKSYLDAPRDVKAFIRLQIFIVLLSSLFMFDLGANTDALYGRFIRFAVIPSCIIMTYFYSIRYKFKYIQTAYHIAFIGTIYTVVYTMYCAFLN